MNARALLPQLSLLILCSCSAPLKLARNDADVVLAHHTIQAPDPTLPGPYTVRHLYYGSGKDKRRIVYRDSVAIRTDSVDASKLVNLTDSASRERRKYWGFTPKAMPLNARVWYPEGTGPFPLVLIVHGNHDMKQFSDPGYEYLGRLLASRGYIFASIDENFLNGSIRGENDARGWFLLKHVEQFKKFNETAGNPFFGKVDLTRVALIGHSRGGEAVGHAAAFNTLSHYPDDASFKFNFHYGIRSIIAIAPVDGQYKPADRLVPVKNVDYFVLHGSHDGDVSSFMGLRQYQRVTFDDGQPHFKAALYVYRANHGQWNTVWNNKDAGPRSARVLDLRGLLPPEEQRHIAEVYISAFLATTLNNGSAYLPLFRDHRVAGNWLPKTLYITRFQANGFVPLATFEEDIDLTTGQPGVTIRGDSLATWKEGGLNLRTGNSPSEGSSLNNWAVTAGWNNRIAGKDTTRMGPPAVLDFTLSDSLQRALQLTPAQSLELLLMPTMDMPGARKDPHPDTTKKEVSKPKPEAKKKSDEEKPPVDLSVEVIDAGGARASVPLSRYGAIRRPLETSVLRRKGWDKQRFAAQYEMVLQTYLLPLRDFVAATPGLDVSRIRSVRLVFDRAVAGTVVVDDIGFAH